jgi:tetratricopeptide (TPR) repeat protein
MVDANRSAPEGTPAYMSPSVAAGHAEDTRCDIYAFGAVMYEMLAGRPPYEGASASAVMQAVLAGPPEPIAALNPKAPKDLAAIAKWCMARELRDRYASMEDVLTDLRRSQSGKHPRGPHGAKLTGTYPRRFLLAAAAILLLLGAGYTAWHLANNTKTSVPSMCREAEQELAAGHLAKAEGLYQEVLAKDPNTREAIFGLGKLEEARVHHAQAIRHYQRARSMDLTNTDALEALISLQIRLSHFGPARAELNRWLFTAPDNETAKQLLAELDEKGGQLGETPPTQQEGAQPPTRPFGRPPQDEAQPRPNLDGRPPREGAPPGRAFGGRPRPPRRMPDSEGGEQ